VTVEPAESPVSGASPAGSSYGAPSMPPNPHHRSRVYPGCTTSSGMSVLFDPPLGWRNGKTTQVAWMDQPTLQLSLDEAHGQAPHTASALSHSWLFHATAFLRVVETSGSCYRRRISTWKAYTTASRYALTRPQRRARLTQCVVHIRWFNGRNACRSRPPNAWYTLYLVRLSGKPAR
jgi:hypothetical protein